MKYATRYEEILHALAEKFFSDCSKQNRPRLSEYAQTLRSDLLHWTRGAADDPPWMLWMKVQKVRMKMQADDYKKPESHRMSSSEWFFFAGLAIHQRLGGYQVRMDVKSLETISSWNIDQNVKLGDIAEYSFPDYVWFEWPDEIPDTYPPWVRKTAGILLTRFVPLDAPSEYLKTMNGSPSEDRGYAIELLRAFVQNMLDGVPCTAYQMFVVQKDGMGYRYMNSVFGHEMGGSILDMLKLQAELGDLDQQKFKETGRVWSNVAVRLLLFALYQKWFSSRNAPVIMDITQLQLPESPHTFYSQKTTNQKKVAVRPQYHKALKPFSL